MLVTTPETYLACPIPECHHLEWLSEEDPDCSLSQMIYHLKGYFSGQHRLSQEESMKWLAKVREVRQ